MLELLKTICKDHNIHLNSHSGMGTIKGFATLFPESGERVIAYNDELRGWAKIKTIAHEIAHHALGHLDGDTLCLGSTGHVSGEEPIQIMEREADIFAAAFTAMVMFMGYSDKNDREVNMA